MLESAVASGEAPGWQLALLFDRIQGLPRIYGSQFDFDASGVWNPLPLEDPDCVDERRKTLGLNTIEERTKEIREQADREGNRPPEDRALYERRFQNWLREAGWRS